MSVSVTYIELAEIPCARRHQKNELKEELIGHLREALRLNKAIRLAVPPEARTMVYSANYRKAAAVLGIGVLISGADWRPFRAATGRERREAGTLYIRVTKAAVKPTGAGGERRPLTIPPAPIERPLRGLEVSR